MPVRSINLRLVIPRSPAGAPLRRSIWTTHAEINAAARYYEENLLRLRAEGYEARPSGEAAEPRRVSLEEAKGLALATGRAAQRAIRGKTESADTTVTGSDSDVVSALQSLYRRIVPTETGAASAQDANAFLSPLTDAASRGFGAAADKMNRPRPNWLSVADDAPSLLDAANSWLASEASAVWRRDTGSPAGWLRAARASKPDWPQRFRVYCDRLADRVTDGPEAAVARLRALCLLPLFPPYFSSRMAVPGGAVTPWDRLAFRLAVAHLLSWEAWCRLASEQHSTRLARLEEYRQNVADPEVDSLLEKVRGYECRRAEELSRLGLGPAVYTIRPRQLRGWPELREAWLKASSRTAEGLRAVMARHQTAKRGRFGDPQVFLWMAEPSQHDLWTGTADVISIAATLNAMRALVDRSHETATMTLPDARLHPRAVQWSAPGDSNLRPYRIAPDSDGLLHGYLCLLRARPEDGRLEDIQAEFRLAPTGQLQAPVLSIRGKKSGLQFTNSAGDRFSGVIGSGDLLFDRGHLGRRTLRSLEDGDIGPVWVKLALELDQVLPDGWARDHARFVRHFRSALGGTTKAEDAVQEGARVLSVDLGLRMFAACSVFALRRSAPENATRFPVALGPRTVWAVHERSFHLTLPDEAPSQTGAEWRRAREEELRRIRRSFARYRRIMRLGDLAAADRPVALDDLRTALEEADAFPFEWSLHSELTGQASVAPPLWADAVGRGLRTFRANMAPVVRDWRRRGREPEPFARAGKSMWSIQHLTDLRRTLQTWSLLGRKSGEIRRLDRASRGVFGAALLDHLDHVKEDRLKTGADLIVRAALGYARDAAGRWARRYPSCDVVLFEDLTRYRMRTDRPRRENSQLMRWAHRAIPAEVRMQGELHGIETVDTSAGFSSRYHARTMTPGIRCQPLSKADFGDPWLRQDLEQLQLSLDDYRIGDLVPRQGGQIFVCLRAGGGLTRIDADINAAQNLQRRFWTRHADPFRLPCSPGVLDGAHVWIPRQMGKRLLGGLGGPGVLTPTGHAIGSCRWEPMRKRRLASASAMTGEDGWTGDAEAEEISGLAEEAEVEAGKVVVFFRDPSGVVLPAAFWYPSKTFWGIVRDRTAAALRKQP